MNALRYLQNRIEAVSNTTTSFWRKRLMCSPDRAEVEAVKEAFARAGIATEIQNNPVAEALGMSGAELWVMDERDWRRASTLYAEMRHGGPGDGEDAMTHPEAQTPDLHVSCEKPEAGKAAPPNGGADDGNSLYGAEPPRAELEQASCLLEREIDQMLERENRLAAECASLRSKVNELDQALTEAQKQLDAKSQLLQHQRSATGELRKQIETLETQRDTAEQVLAGAREEASMEREARLDAERRAEAAAAAITSLEKRLLEQQDLQQIMQAHLASMNSLCGRLHAKRTAID